MTILSETAVFLTQSGKFRVTAYRPDQHDGSYRVRRVPNYDEFVTIDESLQLTREDLHDLLRAFNEVEAWQTGEKF